MCRTNSLFLLDAKVSIPVALENGETHVVLLLDKLHLHHAPDALNTARSYFRLDSDSDALFKAWGDASKHPAFRSSGLLGIRLLRQDPIETVFSFICSQNNSVGRIGRMVLFLKNTYGAALPSTAHGIFQNTHSFPTPERLAADDIEEQLRNAKFGYRSRYIVQAAKFLCANGLGTNTAFEPMRKMPEDLLRHRLLDIPGVGPKVADCIALMSFNQTQIVPIDTHMFKLAVNYFKWIGPRSLLGKNIHALRSNYQSLFGEYSGWAHLILFAFSLQSSRQVGTI